MTDVMERQEALDALVSRVVEVGPANWVQAYAAFEYKQVDGAPGFTWLMIGVVNLGDRWGFGQFESDPRLYDLAMAYYDTFGDQGWSTLELKVDYDSHFDARLGYEPVPPDTFDPALLARLEGYREAWTREYGPAPHAR